MNIDHAIISGVIFSLPLNHSRSLVVSYKRKKCAPSTGEPQGFPHKIFFLAGYLSCEEFIQWQSIFSEIIPFNIEYDMGPAQLMHVVVKNSLMSNSTLLLLVDIHFYTRLKFIFILEYEKISC